MSLFSLLRSKKLVPAWEYQTRGVLWRLLPAADGYLVGEDRDHTKRTVTFFCLDETTGIPRWKDIGFPEQWWIGIEAVHQNVLFLHEFVRPDLPDHKKIIAIDIISGQTLWTNEEYKFMFAYQDCVYAMKELFESIVVYELDLHSGEILRELKDQPEYVRVLRETAAAQQPITTEYPNSFSPDQHTESRPSRPCGTRSRLDSVETDKAGQAFMEHINFNNLRGEIEFIESDSYVVVGHYQNINPNPFEQELDQHLKIIEKESGSVVFSDVLTQKGKMPAPDLFFVRNNVLFYVKNQNLLRAVKLSSQS